MVGQSVERAGANGLTLPRSDHPSAWSITEPAGAVMPADRQDGDDSAADTAPGSRSYLTAVRALNRGNPPRAVSPCTLQQPVDDGVDRGLHSSPTRPSGGPRHFFGPPSRHSTCSESNRDGPAVGRAAPLGRA
jgi:hypothetical protein